MSVVSCLWYMCECHFLWISFWAIIKNQTTIKKPRTLTPDYISYLYPPSKGLSKSVFFFFNASWTRENISKIVQLYRWKAEFRARFPAIFIYRASFLAIGYIVLKIHVFERYGVGKSMIFSDKVLKNQRSKPDFPCQKHYFWCSSKSLARIEK